MSLNVRVITPDKVVWDADTEEIILPSSTGQLGILTGHNQHFSVTRNFRILLRF